LQYESCYSISFLYILRYFSHFLKDGKVPVAKAKIQVEAFPDGGALRRGLTILGTLVEASRPLTSHEIAESVQLTDSTVHRLLQTLLEAGYVSRDSTKKRYHASAKAVGPLTLYHPLQSLRRDAFEPLRALRDQSGLTASIVVFVGIERLVLEVSGASGVLTPFYETCLHNPLHVAVSGKLLLLSMSPVERKRLLGDTPYEALTPKTITSPEQFEKELQQTVDRGYATNIDENFMGLSAIGASMVCGVDQLVGCVMLAGATERFTPAAIKEMGRSLRDTARLISFSPVARAVGSMFSR
jgi:DNA-binding IclR family transcriptional regulator